MIEQYYFPSDPKKYWYYVSKDGGILYRTTDKMNKINVIKSIRSMGDNYVLVENSNDYLKDED